MNEEKRIGKEILTLSNRFRRFMDAKTSAYGITRMQSHVLRYVFSHENDVFQKDIENEFCIRRSSATSLLQIMEKNGLIIRLPSKSDARMKKIVLTEKGREIQSGIHGTITSAETEISELLTDEEKQTLFAIAEKLNNHFSIGEK